MTRAKGVRVDALGHPPRSGGAAGAVAGPADDVDVGQSDGEAGGSAVPGLRLVVGLEVVGGSAVGAPGLRSAGSFGQLGPGPVVAAGGGAGFVGAVVVGGGLVVGAA